MIHVAWTRRAYDNIDDILSYIAVDNPVAADDLDKRIHAAADWVQCFPWLGAEVGSHLVRKLLIPNTKLYLVYRIKEDHVEIVAVYHTAQEFSDRV